MKQAPQPSPLSHSPGAGPAARRRGQPCQREAQTCRRRRRPLHRRGAGSGPRLLRHCLPPHRPGQQCGGGTRLHPHPGQHPRSRRARLPLLGSPLRRLPAAPGGGGAHPPAAAAAAEGSLRPPGRRRSRCGGTGPPRRQPRQAQAQAGLHQARARQWRGGPLLLPVWTSRQRQALPGRVRLPMGRWKTQVAHVRTRAPSHSLRAPHRRGGPTGWTGCGRGAQAQEPVLAVGLALPQQWLGAAARSRACAPPRLPRWRSAARRAAAGPRRLTQSQGLPTQGSAAEAEVIRRKLARKPAALTYVCWRFDLQVLDVRAPEDDELEDLGLRGNANSVGADAVLSSK